MKKVRLATIVAFCSVLSVTAQGQFSGGVHLGIPSGDASEISNFNYGIDVSYLVEISDVFQAGVTTGYTGFSGKSVDIGDFGSVSLGNFGFIPLAGTARYGFSDQIFGAIDLGYGISTNGGTGGVYYQPKVGYQTEMLDIFAFYKGISRDGASIASFGVGAAYKFN